MTFSSGEDPDKRSEHSKSSSRDDIPPEYLGSVLRAEIMPADEVSPDRPSLGSILQRFDFRRIGIIVLIFILIGSGLVCLIGPGKPILEDSLISLKSRYSKSTPTKAPSISPVVIETTQVLPTATIPMTKTPTRKPPTITPTSDPTEIPTEVDSCVNPLDIKLEDVGKTMCVRGTIVGLEERDVGFIVYFSNERGVFYLVTYDFKWDQAEEGDCIQVTGEIQQLGNTPVLVFGWNNLPEFCP
jgi:hypothetical protein